MEALYIGMVFMAILMAGIPLSFIIMVIAANLLDFDSIEEMISGEVLCGDKQCVKDGTATYIDCDTYLALNRANPSEYPVLGFWSDIKLFKDIKEKHSVVFKPKEANKLRRAVINMEQAKKNKEKEIKRQEDHQKACENLKKMYETIKDYSDEKRVELDRALTDNLENTKKMIQSQIKLGKSEEQQGIPSGGV